MRVDIEVSPSEAAAEVWKTIPSFSQYQASSLGRVRRTSKNRNIAQHLNKTGYSTVALSVNAHLYTRLTHVVVAEAFIGPKDVDSYVQHIDGNKLNNAAANLAYVKAYSYSGKRARNLGTQALGVTEQKHLQPGAWYLIENANVLSTHSSRDLALQAYEELYRAAIADTHLLGVSVGYLERTAFVVYFGNDPIRVVSILYGQSNQPPAALEPQPAELEFEER